MLYKNRDRFSGTKEKIGRFFSGFGLHPNAWTLLGIISFLLSVYFLLQESFVLAAVFLAAANFIDVVDGAVARATGKATKFGAYFDVITDKYTEGLFLVSMFFIDAPAFFQPFRFWLLLYMFGTMMTTYSKAAAKEKGVVSKELGGGVVERPERMILLFAGLVLASYDIAYLTYTVFLLAVFSNITVFQRVAAVFKRTLEK